MVTSISVEQDLFGGISSSDEETEINPLDDSNAKPETSYNNDSLTGTDDMTGKWPKHIRQE